MTGATTVSASSRIGSYRKQVTVLASVLAFVGGLAWWLAPQGAAAKGGVCQVTSVAAPIVGSWYVQVYFPGPVNAGQTEETMETFTPNGGIVEANPLNTSPAANSGFWQQNANCTYSARLIEFTYDPNTTAHGIKQLLDIQLTYVLDDNDHLHSTAATANIYNYDSQSGQRLGDPIVLANVTESIGFRFNSWTVPTEFPAEP